MRAVVISPDNAVAARIESVLQKWSWDCRNIAMTDTQEVRKLLGAGRPLDGLPTHDGQGGADAAALLA